MMAAWILASHIICYGATFNHFQGGGFASFFKNGRQVISQVTTAESMPGGTADNSWLPDLTDEL